MNPSLLIRRGFSSLGALVVLAALVMAPAVLRAQVRTKNPIGKFYVASLEGGAQTATGDSIKALTAKSTFRAQGSHIETQPLGTVALVLSNGTGFFLDQDTHLAVEKFTQEPFTAGRTDLTIEPSVSETEIAVSRGILAVSTSKLAAGSMMTFLTPLGSVTLHGGDLVIEVDSGLVKISLLHGEATVHGGDAALGGHVFHGGEQAIIHPGPPGRPKVVEISKIPANELPGIEERVAMAYAARKTMFFQTDDLGDVLAVPLVNASVPVQATVSPSRLPN